MTRSASALRISRTSQILSIRSPVLLPLLSHIRDHPVTRSVVSEPTAHIMVRLCHAMTAIRFGYYENSGTVSLSTCRPSHVPLRRNVLARRRCPIHALQCAHCALPTGQGVAWKKVDSRHTDGVGCTDVLPTSVRFHRWTLGFGQCSSHHIAQALQNHAIHVFGHLPLSDHALVPSPFRVEVRRSPRSHLP